MGIFCTNLLPSVVSRVYKGQRTAILVTLQLPVSVNFHRRLSETERSQDELLSRHNRGEFFCCTLGWDCAYVAVGMKLASSAPEHQNSGGSYNGLWSFLRSNWFSCVFSRLPLQPLPLRLSSKVLGSEQEKEQEQAENIIITDPDRNITMDPSQQLR